MHTSSDMSLEAYILEHQQVNYHFTPVLFTFYEAVQVKKAMTLSGFSFDTVASSLRHDPSAI